MLFHFESIVSIVGRSRPHVENLTIQATEGPPPPFARAPSRLPDSLGSSLGSVAPWACFEGALAKGVAASLGCPIYMVVIAASLGRAWEPKI